MSKAIRSLTKEEAKVSFKGKTITLKDNDDIEKRKEVNSLLKNDKIKLLYVSVINDISNFVYEYQN